MTRGDSLGTGNAHESDMGEDPDAYVTILSRDANEQNQDEWIVPTKPVLGTLGCSEAEAVLRKDEENGAREHLNEIRSILDCSNVRKVV